MTQLIVFQVETYIQIHRKSFEDKQYFRKLNFLFKYYSDCAKAAGHTLAINNA